MRSTTTQQQQQQQQQQQRSIPSDQKNAIWDMKASVRLRGDGRGVDVMIMIMIMMFMMRTTTCAMLVRGVVICDACVRWARVAWEIEWSARCLQHASARWCVGVCVLACVQYAAAAARAREMLRLMLMLMCVRRRDARSASL